MELKGIVFLPTSNNFPERLERDLILKLIQKKPDTFIFLLPDGHTFIDALSIDYLTKVNFKELEIPSNIGFLDDFRLILERERIPSIFLNPSRFEEYQIKQETPEYLNHFITLLNKVNKEFRISLITTGNLSKDHLLRTGSSIRESVERIKEPCILVIFSNLIDNPEYKDLIGTCMEADNFFDLLQQDIKPYEENQYNALIVGIGATDKLKMKSESLSSKANLCYNLEFLVESLDLKESNIQEFTKDSIIAKWNQVLKEQRRTLIENEGILQKLVRETLNVWLKEGQKLDFNTYAELNIKDPTIIDRLKTQRTGVFITINKDNQFRSSMGTINPVYSNIGEELINNTLEAAFFVPDRVPLTFDELEYCSFEVDVLNPPEAIEDIKDLDPQKYGIIVEQGFKRGVVLPGIKDVNTPEEQIQLAKDRGGIDDITDNESRLLISRFTTENF